MANQTVYPYGTGGELPSSIGIINDLTTGGVNKALSAEMGKTLNGNLTQLGQDVNGETIVNSTDANGVKKLLTTPLPAGATITSVAGLSSEASKRIVLYENEQDSTGIYVYVNVDLPYTLDKKYEYWQMYESGYPTCVMTAVVPGIIDYIADLQSDVSEMREEVDGLESELKILPLAFSLVSNPARKDGSSSSSGYFAGYQADLTGLYPKYKYVYFRGSSYGTTSTISPGIILDGNNAVESYVPPAPIGNGWYALPLTANSKTLWATYCKSASGGEVWSPEYVTARELPKSLYEYIAELGVLPGIEEDIFGIEMPITGTGFISLASIGSTASVTADGAYKYIRYPVEPGDLLLIDAAQVTREPFGFLDEDGKILSAGRPNMVTLHNFFVMVADNAKEVVINLTSNSTQKSFIFKANTTKNKVEAGIVKDTAILEELGIMPIESWYPARNPARRNGSDSDSGYFSGYKVDLTGLYPKYKYIYFRGSEYTQNEAVTQITRGLILDNNNAVEIYAPFVSASSNGWQALPLTANSKTLWATICFNSTGGEVWGFPSYVVAMENPALTKELLRLVVDFEGIIAPLDDNRPVLPSQIHAVLGEQVQLFKNAIVASDFDAVSMGCVGGRNFRRYMNFIPAAAGDVALSVSVNDAVASSTIKVVSPSNPSSRKNVLIVGASTTDNYKTQFEELYRRLVLTSGSPNITAYGATIRDPKNPLGLGLSNIAFVGRKSNGQNFNYEATGGYSYANYYGTASNYNYAFIVADTSGFSNGAVYSDGTHNFTITEISAGDGRISARCSTPGVSLPASGSLSKSSGSGPATLTYTSYSETLVRPFLNPNTLQTSMQYYMTTYCGGASVDIVYFNGLMFNSGYDFNDLENYAKPLARIIHSEYPGAKIIFGSGALSDTRGNGLAATYNSTSVHGQTAEANKKVRELIGQLDKLCADLNTEFGAAVCVPSCLALQTDSDYDYPVTSKDVDNRNTETEGIGTNGNHPTNVGILNHIDAIYRSICYVIATYFN